jgi:hypothetical protein
MAAEAETLGDKVFSVANEMIVSDRVWNALQAIGSTDHLHAIRTTVIDPQRAPVGKVWWLVPLVEHDALHRKLARYRIQAGTRSIGRVLHWALDATKIPDAGLWHEANGRWFASRELFEIWGHNKFIGARFEEVTVA